VGSERLVRPGLPEPARSGWNEIPHERALARELDDPRVRPVADEHALVADCDAVRGREGDPRLRAGDEFAQPDPEALHDHVVGREGRADLQRVDAGTDARDVTLLATGSEVSLAVDARAELAKEGIAAAVVSMPSWERFDRQDADYRAAVLGTAPRIAVEAAVAFGWERYLGGDGAFVGMTGFGASAPGAALFEHFGITAAAVAGAARELLGRR